MLKSIKLFKFKMKGRFLVNQNGFSYWSGTGQEEVKTPAKQAQKITKKEQPPKESGPRYDFTTFKEYFEDTYKFESTASLLDIVDFNGETSLVFDRTIFHP